MLSKIVVFFLIFQIIESNPHLYRRHHSYYHHGFPYQFHHVNYSPYGISKRTYYGLDASSVYNDLDDSSLNEPVKGGIKNPNQNQIKTPMKLFSERKNSGLSLQEKLSGTKGMNPSSIKQQQSVIYPSSNIEPNEETINLPVLEENKKKISIFPNKKIFDVKGPSKVSSKTKLTTEQTIVDVTSSKSTNEKQPSKVETTNHESNLEPLKTNQTNSKPTANNSSEPTTLSSLNIIEINNNLENKDVKVNNVTNSEPTVEILSPSSETLKFEPNLIKPKITDTTELKTIMIKSEEAKKPENVINKVEDKSKDIPVIKTDNSTSDSDPKLENSNLTNSQTLTKPKPSIVEDSSIAKDPKPIMKEDLPSNLETNLLDDRKKLEKPLVSETTTISKNLDQTVAKSKLNNLTSLDQETVENLSVIQKNNIALNKRTSVDVLPPSNTESSLTLDNETINPMIN